MKYKNYAWIILKLIALCVLTASVIIESNLMQKVQGNGRVINFSGFVRGATQRLIKLELQGTHDDPLILYLDTVLQDLNGGDGEFALPDLEDERYSTLLDRLQAMWGSVKESIYLVRAGEATHQLLEISEDYFSLADAVTDAAERYTDNLTDQIWQVQQLSIICIVIMLVDLLYQTIRAFNLNNIAFADKQTGLAIV